MSGATIARPQVALYAEQAAFVFDGARYPAFVAGRNSGKTVAGAVKAANRCAKPGLGVIAAPSFPMLTHAAKRAFLAELRRRADADPRWAFVEHKSERLLTIPATGAEVLFGSLDNPDSVRGPNFAWGWLDEPGYTSDEAWLNLKGSVRDGDNPQIWPTGTPKGRHHFLYREWMVAPDADHTYHHATSLQNPFVDAAAYVAGLGYRGVFYDQEVGGDFVAFEGLVYPEFRRQTHVAAVDCAGWGTMLAVDVGARNPTAILTVRFVGDRIHVGAEQYRPMHADQIIDAVVDTAAATGALYAVVDPSAKLVIGSLAARGVPCRLAVNDVTEGVRRVSSQLPELTVDPSCVNLIGEFEAYAYPDGQTKDAPVKANDHAMDALRYAVMDLTTPAPVVAIY
jgi:phage terminase large subunit